MIGLLIDTGLGRTPKLREILTFVMSLVLAFWPLAMGAQSVTLQWTPSSSPNVTGYLVYSGTDGTNFDNPMDVGTNNPVTVTNVTPGATNYFEVIAYDAYDDLSPPSAAVSGFISNDSSQNTDFPVGKTIVTNAGTGFALLVSGDGTLLPSRTLKKLLEGKKYTLTAAPAKGSVFANWYSNGIVVSTNPKYTFTVDSNEMLQANFVTNPFIPVVGTYYGLFYVTSNAAEESSGSIVATVTGAGTFSAKLSLGAQNHSYTGQFSFTGASTKSIARPGLNPITVQLQLGLTNGPMTGTVSDGDWTADLVADPAFYSKTNPAPQAGKYTLVIPGNNNGADQPAGNGFGSVTINALGKVNFSGMLGDGTPVTSTSIVSSDGQWPFYASLYGGKGSILAWLSFTNNGVISGQMNWFKLPQATANLYPSGFTNSPEAVGSVYLYTNGLPILGFTNGLLSLTSGNFQQSITNQVALVPDKEDSDQNGATLTFNTSSGLFKGTVMNAETSKPIAFKGAILQNQNMGAGFFLSTNESGSVILSPAQ